MKYLSIAFLLLFLSTGLKAQVVLKGNVSNEQGESIPGVSVLVKGTNEGTITDIKGDYTLKTDLENGTLVFTFIGMKSYEIGYSGSALVDVIMEDDLVSLDEVVAIGYGTVKRRDLTGAVASVRSEEIKMAPVSNALEALQGRVAGLDITRSSGKSGTQPQVLLRGNKSLLASSKPLYIVDGIPGDISALNPNDIESVDVLKDASSTSIYGVSGANGVIIVTTKKAQKGKVQIDVDAYNGVNSMAYYPSALQGDTWFDYLETGYVAAYDEMPEDRNQLLTAYSISPEIVNPYIDAGKWIDWVDETLQAGTQQNYNVSVRGGNAMTQAYFSLGYNSEQGIYKYDKTDQLTLRTGVTHHFKNWASAGVQTSLTWRDRDSRNSRVNKTFGTIPLGDVYNEIGEINAEPIEGHSTVSLIADDVSGVYLNNSKQIYINVNPFLEIRPIKGLNLKTLLGTTLAAGRTGVFENERTYMNLAGSGSPMKKAQYRTYMNYNYVWDNILTYEYTLNDRHFFNFTGLTEWQKNQSESSYAYNEGFDYDEFVYYNLGAGNNPSVSSSYSHNNRMSYAVRLNYNFDGKYYVTATNRWDGASVLAEGNQWDSFFSGALAWRVSSESFMEGTEDWLSNFKVRIGYGVGGNPYIAPYTTQAAVGSSNFNLTLGDTEVPLYVLSQTVGNSQLGWEKSYNTNAGFDLGLFNQRIELVLDWYVSQSKDVIYNRPVPTSLGGYNAKTPYTSTANIAQIENRGIELTLQTRNIQTRDFKWNSSIIFASNNEQLVDIDLGSEIEVDELIALGLFVGHPKNTLYGYKKLGIWQLDEAEEAALYGRVPGEIRIETVEQFDEEGVGDEGIHEYSAEDMQVLGAESPDWTLGFQNSFYWKNFDLNIFMNMRWGYLMNAELLGYFKYGNNNIPEIYDYWTPDNPTNYYPQPNLLGNTNDVTLRSLSIVDGSFLKIRNISLGYTLGKRLSSKVGLQKLRIYGTISNPYIYAKSELLKEIDPETKGSDSFPLYRQLVFGINMSF